VCTCVCVCVCVCVRVCVRVHVQWTERELEETRTVCDSITSLV